MQGASWLCWLGSLVVLAPCPLLAQQSNGGAPSRTYEATPQRPTFTANTTTSVPGTVEMEFGATVSDKFLTLPTTLKYTPEVPQGLFHQAEFSVSFDALSNHSAGSGRVTQCGNSLGIVMRRLVYLGDHISVAVAPRILVLLRGDHGLRIGARAIAAYDAGLNSTVVNFTWTAATSSSPTNPEHEYDIALDYSRTLGKSTMFSRWSVFAGVLSEQALHRDAAVSLGQGMSYRFRPGLVGDLAIRETGLGSGWSGYEALLGLTVNLGRVERW